MREEGLAHSRIAHSSGFAFIDYTEEELLRIASLPQVDQSGNTNSNSKIFFDEKFAYKIYEHDNPATSRCIEALLLLGERHFGQCLSVVLPEEIIMHNQRIVGYTMRRLNGVTLGSLLSGDPPTWLINSIFSQVLDAILNLPSGVHIGDLHGGNVMVVGEGAFLIDVDGFSFRDGPMGTCPLDGYDFPGISKTSSGEVVRSAKSDISCLLVLYFDYLLNGPSFLCMESSVMRGYFTHLESLLPCAQFVHSAKDFLFEGKVDNIGNVFSATEQERSVAAFEKFFASQWYQLRLREVAGVWY